MRGCGGKLLWRMAWRLWSKLCRGHKWLLLLCPFLLLLFLTISIMTIPLPALTMEPDRRSSRALSSAGEFGSPFRIEAWGGKSQLPLPEGRNHISLAHADRNKHKSETVAGATLHPADRYRPHLPIDAELKPRIKPGDRSAVVKRRRNKPTREDEGGSEDERKQKSGEEQRAAEKPGRALQKSLWEKDHRPVHRRKTLFKSQADGKNDDRCGGLTERDFPDADRRKVRVGARPLPWLSPDDIQKMELLAGGALVSKARVPAHGQVLQVALEPPAHQKPSSKSDISHSTSHTEECQRGRCALIKRTDDWFEVFAFHLDRVLGLNRSLPVVLRTFRSDVLPYRYTSGTPRPVLWWDPDIQHLADADNDQNSVPLGWVRYQKVLRLHCGSEADLSSAPCVGVHHSEWGRLALFDFLLQVNDRLDRYCCGFTPDPSELCVENLLHAKCDNTENLQLVHILVRKADPSRLVFIDNAGRPQQPTHNLNFRLLEGVDEFPESAVSVLSSGCLERLLLRSLYTDREFWDSQGGLRGLRGPVHMVQERGNILLRHIRDTKLQLKRDL